MLVLTRKTNQQIVIGDGVRVTVLGVDGHRVRLGIEAPIETPVHRREVHEAIRRAKREEKPPSREPACVSGR
jgi:carbon storage regulator